MSESKHTFYFDGIDVEDLGLYYAPEVKGSETYVWGPATAKIQEESFESHDGGYYYGKSLSIKEFNLRCYYYQTPQEEGLINKVLRHFAIGKRGLLRFERRPWLAYDVRITKVDFDTMYNFQNGIVVISCKAYSPYSISTKEYNDYTIGSEEYNILYNNSNIWKSNSNMMYPSKELITSSTTVTSSGRHYYLYNPGDCEANTKITICAEATNGITIGNLTLGNNCIMQPIEDDYTYIVNGDTGKVYDLLGNLQFRYHKAGFVKLKPNAYIKNATYTISDDTVTANRNFTPQELQLINSSDAYIYDGTNVYTIESVGTNYVKASSTISGNNVVICTMNDIFVHSTTTSTVNTLTINFDYKFE